MKSMRTWYFPPVAAAVLFALLAVPLTVYGTSVSPTDYQVPVSMAQQARLGATYGYAGSGSDVQKSDGSVAVLVRHFYNSLPYAYDLSFNGIGSTLRLNDKQQNSYNFIADAGVRKYFSEVSDFFYSLDGRVTGNNDYDRPAVETTPGVGYGRFIRVTTLARAVRIEDFLLKENVIKGELPKATMIEIAQVIEREDEFRTQYGDRYRVRWFEAIEEAIARSGMFTEVGLGAAGTLRVEEVLFQERVNERFIGWDARAGVRIELMNPYKHQDLQDPGLSARVRYSRPVGWKSQVDVNVQYSSPFTGDFGRDIYTLSGTLNYIYELSNRIDFTATNIITSMRSDPNFKEVVTEHLRSGFIFYLENQINLNMTGELSKTRGHKAFQSFNLSLEYRLR